MNLMRCEPASNSIVNGQIVKGNSGRKATLYGSLNPQWKDTIYKWAGIIEYQHRMAFNHPVLTKVYKIYFLRPGNSFHIIIGCLEILTTYKSFPDWIIGSDLSGVMHSHH